MLLALALPAFASVWAAGSGRTARPVGIPTGVDSAPPGPIEYLVRPGPPHGHAGTYASLVAPDRLVRPLSEFEPITHAYGVHLPRYSGQIQDFTMSRNIHASLVPAGFTRYLARG